MKLFNKIFTILLNAAVMGVVIMIMKTQDDMKLSAQQNSAQLYSNLIAMNNVIAQNRTNTINQIKNQINVGKIMPSTPSTPAKSVTPSPKPSTTQSPVVQPPVISIPQPNPVVTTPPPQQMIIPNRTTRTS